MLKFLGQYIFNLLLGFDQFINVVILGDPDMSISTRVAHAQKTGKPKWFVKPLGKFIDFLFMPFEDNHIENSWEQDELGEKELWKWYHE